MILTIFGLWFPSVVLATLLFLDDLQGPTVGDNMYVLMADFINTES